MKTISAFAWIFILTLIISLFQIQSVFALGDWKEIKPYYGAQIISMERHPGGKIFAGAMYGDLYVSSDDGRNWQWLNNFNIGIYLSDVSNICIDSHGTIYVSTIPNGGVFKSTDEGLNWTMCNLPNPSIDIFKLTRNDNDELFIGARSGIYFSIDGGLTWTQILSTNSAYVECIEFKDGKIFATVDQFGLLISSDKGKTWQVNRLPQSSYHSLVVLNEKEFLVSMYSIIPWFERGIFKSIDGGLNWQKIGANLPVGNLSQLRAKDGVIYFTTNLGKIYRTMDKGNNWEELTSGKVGVAARSLLVEKNKLIASTVGGGILTSTDNGKSWTITNNGLPKTTVRDILKLPDGKFLIANSAGLFRYDPVKEECYGLNEFLDKYSLDFKEGCVSSEIVGMCLMNDKSLYVGNYQGMISTSSDFGVSWTNISTPTDLSGMLIFQQGNKNNIYVYGVMSSGLYAYNCNSKSWMRSQPDFRLCRAMKIDSNDSLYLAVDKAVYKSSDVDKTWNVYSNIFNSDVLHIDITKEHKIIVSTWQGLFQSCDDGITWKHTPFQIGYSAIKCNGVLELSDGHFLLYTDHGLYESTDNGINWTQRYDELSQQNVKKLVRTEDGRLYAITDKGLYENSELISSVLNSPPLPEQFSLEQNYPNPFNPTTKISFSLPQKSQIKLKVFDVLGREIQILADGVYEAGKQEIEFNATTLPSGVYFYNLATASGSFTKKMVVVK